MVDKENHASLGPKLPSASRTENNSLCSLPFLSFGRFQETERERRESVVHNAALSLWSLLETGRDNDGGSSHDTARGRAWRSRKESPPADPGIKAEPRKP